MENPSGQKREKIFTPADENIDIADMIHAGEKEGEIVHDRANDIYLITPDFFAPESGKELSPEKQRAKEVFEKGLENGTVVFDTEKKIYILTHDFFGKPEAPEAASVTQEPKKEQEIPPEAVTKAEKILKKIERGVLPGFMTPEIEDMLKSYGFTHKEIRTEKPKKLFEALKKRFETAHPELPLPAGTSGAEKENPQAPEIPEDALKEGKEQKMEKNEPPAGVALAPETLTAAESGISETIKEAAENQEREAMWREWLVTGKIGGANIKKMKKEHEDLKKLLVPTQNETERLSSLEEQIPAEWQIRLAVRITAKRENKTPEEKRRELQKLEKLAVRTAPEDIELENVKTIASLLGPFRNLVSAALEKHAKQPEKFEDELEKIVADAGAYALTELARGQKPDFDHFAVALLKHLPEHMFPGIKALEKEKPELFNTMQKEVVEALTEPEGAAEEKLETVLNKYNVLGETAAEAKGLQKTVHELLTKTDEKTSPEHAKKVEETSEKIGRLKESASVLGFVGLAVLIVLIFAFALLSTLVGSGTKGSKKK